MPEDTTNKTSEIRQEVFTKIQCLHCKLQVDKQTVTDGQVMQQAIKLINYTQESTVLTSKQ